LTKLNGGKKMRKTNSQFGSFTANVNMETVLVKIGRGGGVRIFA
jgi:hypothetical protein